MTRRLFAGGIATETNTFSPIPTGYDDFRSAAADATPEERDLVLFGHSFRAYEVAATARGWAYVQGSHAFAEPAGLTTRSAYERLRDRLLGEVRDSRPLDAVILTLHGAMVAHGVEDCETDLVEHVRRLVGRARIGVLLDLHCDVPRALLDASDAVITLVEYPHVDVQERAAELAELVLDAAEGRVSPVSALFDCRMVGLYPTVSEPMRGFVDRTLLGAQREPRTLAVSLAHGFPFADTPDMGARVIAIGDGDELLASEVAERVGRAFYALRHKVTLMPLELDEALDRALAISWSGRPVVVADTSDNAGGGAPSDSTFVLRELLLRGVRNAGVAPLWDPVAVRLAFAAGTDATLSIRLGGKMGPASGDPLDVTARVRGLVPELVQRWPQSEGFAEVPSGDAACLAIEGVDVVVSSRRVQALGLELFRAFGVDPAGKRLLVLKSTNHFQAAYGPIAEEVLYASPPGALVSDPRQIPYARADTRKYPWLDDLFADG